MCGGAADSAAGQLTPKHPQSTGIPVSQLLPDPSSFDHQKQPTMRLSIAVATALSGLAAAASSQAPVYLFREPPAKPRDYAPGLQPQVARLIFAHRLAVDNSFTVVDELEALPDAEEAVTHINAYARNVRPWWVAPEPEPAKLMVVLEGLEDGQMEQVMEGREKAFVIDEAPNAAANDVLIDGELAPAGAPTSSCAFESAINPLDKDCFSGSASIIRYDVKKVIMPHIFEVTCTFARHR